jgi:spore germination protein PC
MLQNSMSCQQMFQQIYAHLNWQAQRIETLEQNLSKVQTELNAIKEQKRIHIDKIEYNFDQLKVERLDGSLSIGVNPGTFDEPEDFTVNDGAAMGDPSMKGAPMSSMQHDISGSIQEYLSHDAKEDMRTTAAKFQYPLEEGYEELILDDIRNQVEPRIQNYLKQYRSAGFKEPMDGIRENIVNQTKRDIQSAIESYISHLASKEGEKP